MPSDRSDDLRTAALVVLGLAVALATSPSSVVGQAPGVGRASRQMPRVRSKAAVEQDTSPSPGDYRGDVDDAPPEERGSFFGVPARGQVFAFVIDCSGSMAEGRLLRAKAELRKSLGQLKHPQRYFVVFYDDRPRIMPGGVPRSADFRTFDAVDRWLRQIDAEGGTDPREAMGLALGMKPDAVFLLSDGELPRGSAREIAARNRAKVPIHCVALGRAAGADALRQIAAESGGRFAAR